MKILIAEDEEDIVMQYKIALELRKHQVVVTENGEECMKVYNDALQRTGPSDSSSPFDVVILDHRMPNQNGFEVAKEILKVNPSQRIIFASAYMKDMPVSSLKEMNRVIEVIQKPFRLSSLIEMVETK